MRRPVTLLVGLVMLVSSACGGDDESAVTTEASGTTSPVTSANGESDDFTTTTTAAMSSDSEEMVVQTDTSGETQNVGESVDQGTAVTTPEVVEPESQEVVEIVDVVATLRALGPMRIGMSVDEATAELGAELRQDFGRQATGSCYYVTAGTALPGVAAMVVDGQIVRIEIDSPSGLGTRSGVRIGTSAEDLEKVYPDNIQAANEAVEGGEAMAFVPNDDYDSNYRIYFEMEGGQVARYRLGVKPAIDYLSGCPEE